MLGHFRIPLLFLFVGSLLGLFLRWQFISPTPGINYSFVLHGHSHIMFLGWIFNALYIAFITNHIVETERSFFWNLYYVLQFLVVGMLISFPLQGYGLFSITFSTLHTIGAILFAIRFFYKTKSVTTISSWYARISLVFLVISTIGPFSLGYLMANGMGQSNWYYFSIYFYLHFQYNGFFLFGIFSLIFDLLERRSVQFDFQRVKFIGKLLAATCIPAYVLSILWARPSYIFNVVGGVTAVIQIFVLAMLIGSVVNHRQQFKCSFTKSSNQFLAIALSAFGLKLALQLLSAFPAIAQLAYEMRPVVIGYLHLVLIGVISLSLFVWYLESNLIGQINGARVITALIISFMGMEVCLILSPWWSKTFVSSIVSAQECMFFFSASLSLSCLLLYMSSCQKNQTKISF
jgi:hypothetical protein